MALKRGGYVPLTNCAIGSHSKAYTLSDQKEKLLEKNDTIDDDMICQDCFNLISTLDKVKEGVNNTRTDDKKKTILTKQLLQFRTTLSI